MSYLNWHVGMKVVCVDADDAEELAVGETYTITQIGYRCGLLKGKEWHGIAISLKEARGRTELGFMHDDGFAAARFRPVQIRATDISIFTSMLTNTKQTVQA